jgi:hypothetical protein
MREWIYDDPTNICLAGGCNILGDTSRTVAFTLQ